MATELAKLTVSLKEISTKMRREIRRGRELFPSFFGRPEEMKELPRIHVFMGDLDEVLDILEGWRRLYDSARGELLNAQGVLARSKASGNPIPGESFGIVNSAARDLSRFRFEAKRWADELHLQAERRLSPDQLRRLKEIEGAMNLGVIRREDVLSGLMEEVREQIEISKKSSTLDDLLERLDRSLKGEKR